MWKMGQKQGVFLFLEKVVIANLMFVKNLVPDMGQNTPGQKITGFLNQLYLQKK